MCSLTGRKVVGSPPDRLGQPSSPRLLAPQLIVAPPSITMVWPVMKSPAFEPRNTAAPAISPGRPMRSSGERAAEAFRFLGLSHRGFGKGVLDRPGAVQFQRMLGGPYLQAKMPGSCMWGGF